MEDAREQHTGRDNARFGGFAMGEPQPGRGMTSQPTIQNLTSKILIAPSLLAADYSCLAEEIQRVEAAGADWLHLDVMDGHFVPNMTFGPLMVTAIRKLSKLPLDIHLMIDDPATYAPQFIGAGGHGITVHIESPAVAEEERLCQVLTDVKRRGARSGVTIKPATPDTRLTPAVLEVTDLVLVMTVEPGFGGQAFLPQTLPKVQALRQRYRGDIEVDGGITAETAPLAVAAGANILVSGTYVFNAPNCRAAIQQLRQGMP